LVSDPVYAQKITDGIPAGYYAEPEDCAGIISLLCSEEGRYITGQNIFVDGGMSIK
jgi:NAD(P)-dependent dehydrogenase (short-subunit alcohol dehydrogenase family)